MGPVTLNFEHVTSAVQGCPLVPAIDERVVLVLVVTG
jgi:hypothetical protein